MQNKPNFHHFSTKNEDLMKKQTQFKPNQSQSTSNITADKPVRKPLNLRIIWIDFKSEKRYNKGHKSNIWGAKTTEK